MAKNSGADKVYIREFDVTIKKSDFYDPEAIIQNPKVALVTPGIFTIIYVICVISGPEQFLLVSGIVIGLLLMQSGVGSSEKQVLDAYRFALDVVTAKTVGQPEDNKNHLSVEEDVDLAGKPGHEVPEDN